ncbi:MAG: hypothetical protein NT010_07845 [Proteobacteria bacterium]|nr:hypothetical protein [Pseudomonadota bacterium]
MRKIKSALSVSRMSKFFVLTAVLTLVCLGGIAHADNIIGYTVSGWGPTSYPAPTTPPSNAPWGTDGYPGDTLELVTYTGSLNLEPGTYTQKINTLLWTINYTYGGTATDPSQEAWRDLSFNVNASRTIYFAAASGSLSQTGLLEVKWDNDYLTFYNGTTISLIFQGYKVDITPLGFATVPGSNFDGYNPWVQPQGDIMARFDVSAAPVPIPPTVLLLGSSLIGLAGLRRKFKNYMNK